MDNGRLEYTRDKTYKGEHTRINALNDKGEIMGYTVTRPDPAKRDKTIAISELYVDPNFRGNGIASVLINKVKSDNQQKNLVLRALPYKDKSVDKDNLKKIYSSHGFSSVSGATSKEKRSDDIMIYKVAAYKEQIEKIAARAWKKNFGNLSEEAVEKLREAKILDHEKELAGLDEGSREIAKKLGVTVKDWDPKTYKKDMRGVYRKRFKSGIVDSHIASGRHAKTLKYTNGNVSLKDKDGKQVIYAGDFASSDLLNDGVKSSDMKDMSKGKLNARYVNGLTLRHEVDEARETARLQRQRPTKNWDGPSFHSHVSPAVIARESANVAIAPEEAKKVFTKMRERGYPSESNTIEILTGKKYGKDAVINKKDMYKGEDRFYKQYNRPKDKDEYEALLKTYGTASRIRDPLYVASAGYIAHKATKAAMRGAEKIKKSGVKVGKGSVKGKKDGKFAGGIGLAGAGAGAVAYGRSKTAFDDLLDNYMDKQASKTKEMMGTLSEGAVKRLEDHGIINYKKQLDGLNKGTENIAKRYGAHIGHMEPEEAIKYFENDLPHNKGLSRQLDSQGLSMNHLMDNLKSVKEETNGFFTYPGVKHKAIIKGELKDGNVLSDVMGGLPKDDFHKKYLEGVFNRHEADELRFTERNLKGHKNSIDIGDGFRVGTANYSSHTSPKVIGAESVNITHAPKEVREKASTMRTNTGEQYEITSAGIDYGKTGKYNKQLNQRLNRQLASGQKDAFREAYGTK